MSQLKVTSVALTIEHITFTKAKGNTSRYIRSLIDREIGNEQAMGRCQALVRAYQHVLASETKKSTVIQKDNEALVDNLI